MSQKVTKKCLAYIDDVYNDTHDDGTFEWVWFEGYAHGLHEAGAITDDQLETIIEHIKELH